MAPHSSTFAWKIPWTEEPPAAVHGVARSRTGLSDFTFTFHFHASEKEMATHSSVLAWWAAVYGVAQSRTRLKRLSSSSSSRNNICNMPSTEIAANNDDDDDDSEY